MAIRRNVGRPSKVDYRVMMRIAAALQHSASVADACRYAQISRDTYYRHVKNEPEFAKTMRVAKANQFRLMSYPTFY